MFSDEEMNKRANADGTKLLFLLLDFSYRNLIFKRLIQITNFIIYCE